MIILAFLFFYFFVKFGFGVTLVSGVFGFFWVLNLVILLGDVYYCFLGQFRFIFFFGKEKGKEKFFIRDIWYYLGIKILRFGIDFFNVFKSQDLEILKGFFIFKDDVLWR